MTRIEFRGAGGAMLSARLEEPLGSPRAYALFAHCFTCSKQSHAANRVSAALAAKGIAVLRFDFTGLGSSGGDFANTNFSSNVGDLRAAAQYLRESYAAPTLLVGHSLGGAAVLAAASDLPECRAVATIGAPADPAHLKALFQGSLEEIESTGEAEVALGGRKFRIQRQFLRDLESQPLSERIGGLRRALLVLHSPFDAVVGVEESRAIFEAARHPKSFVSLDGADHLLTRAEDAAYAAEVIAAWASRYLPEAENVEAPPEGRVEVAETGEGHLTQSIRVGRHLLVADEPKSLGGADLGPSPYDYLLAGLGACTAMTLRLYAERKKLPLEHVSVRLRHEKVHASDCQGCETTEGRIDRIDREIVLRGNLDGAARERLLEIADRCPVHRTLHGEIDVRTLAVDE